MRARLGTGLALSAALHGAAGAALLLPWILSGAGGGAPVPLPPLEVELIQVSSAGADPVPQAPAQAAPMAPAPMPPATAQAAPVEATPVPPVPPRPRDADGEPAPAPASMAASAPPAPRPAPAPSQPPTPIQPAMPAVNLGMGGQALEDMDARSDDVVPPRPDSRHRNLPPAYPALARRLHQEGTVHLLIHVTADGIPLLVEVAGSSGHPSLDEAAVQAVEQWRFNPARGARGPVPYSFPLAINFIGDRR